MPTPALSGGQPVLIPANTIYAIPVGPYRLLSTGALTFATTIGGAYAALAGATTEPGVLVSNGFIQAAAPQTVVIKRITRMGSYAGVVAQSNPLAFWRFNEQTGNILYDSIGVENLTKGSGVTLATAGALGDGSLAITCDGTVNGFASTSSGVNTWFGASAVSFEAWIFNPAFGAGHEMIVSLGGLGIYMSVNASKLFMSIHTGTQMTCQSIADVPANQWVHVVASWMSGEKINLYVNGVLVADNNPTTRTGTLGSSVNYFVGALGPNLLTWSGILDDVAVYLRKLTAAEISKHYGARMSY